MIFLSLRFLPKLIIVLPIAMAKLDSFIMYKEAKRGVVNYNMTSTSEHVALLGSSGIYQEPPI